MDGLQPSGYLIYLQIWRGGSKSYWFLRQGLEQRLLDTRILLILFQFPLALVVLSDISMGLLFSLGVKQLGG